MMANFFSCVLFVTFFAFYQCQVDQVAADTPRFLQPTSCKVETDLFVKNLTEEIERRLVPVEEKGYQANEIDELEGILQGFFDRLINVLNNMSDDLDSFIEHDGGFAEYYDDDYLSEEYTDVDKEKKTESVEDIEP